MGFVKEYADGRIARNIHDMQLDVRAVIYNAEQLAQTANIKMVLSNCQLIIDWMCGRQPASLDEINTIIHDTFKLIAEELNNTHS